MATNLPDEFKCPISLEVMSDPVMILSGHSFDRASIQKWLDSGNRTCPITKMPLSDPPLLIPNHALRSLISNFGPGLEGTTRVDPVPELDPMGLVAVLSSRRAPFEEKIKGLDSLCAISKRDSVTRKRLTESGAVSAVLNCVDSGELGSLGQEKALKLLLNLSLDDDNKVGLVAEGAVGKIVMALGSGNAVCRAMAATMVTSLAVVEVNNATIGAYPNAIRGLVRLLREGGARERKEAATALYVICSYPDNRRRAVECGTVPILINAIECGQMRAVEVISLLAKCCIGRDEIDKIGGCMNVLVRVLKSGRGVVYALSTINSLCCGSDKMGFEAMQEGVIELCGRFVRDENEKVRKMASSLLTLLGRKCGEQ